MPGRTRRAAAALAVVTASALTAGLAGCSGGSAPGASAGPPTTSLPPEPPAPPTSDDKGRAYDLGTIRKVETQAGVQVVVLDRWTVKKVSDATLAKDGVPIRKYRAKKSPYTNQNTKVTFRIPVADHPVIVLRHCLSWNEPLQAKSTTLKGLAAAGGNDSIVLVTLDERGWLTSAQNLPGC